MAAGDPFDAVGRRVMVVDDDMSIAELIRYTLEREGYAVSCLDSGEKVLLAAGIEKPDLVTLDILLPGINGFKVLEVLKADGRTRSIPVLVVSGRSSEADVEAARALGADAFLAKPFSPKVLVSCARNLLEGRVPPAPAASGGEGPIICNGISIDTGRHEVIVDGRVIDLTVNEMRIIAFLARHPGVVFSRERIVEAVRGNAYRVTERAVDVAIFGLRRKLGRAGRFVETVRGVGYRFHDAVDRVEAVPGCRKGA